MLYIFDLDGTLSDLSHRLHFIQSKPADWKSFYQACDMDKPIPEVINLARLIHGRLTGLIIISGRSDECRDKTIRWLAEEGVPYDYLYMRREGDYRLDTIVKSELLDRFLQEVPMPLTDIGGVFEDRKQVVDMFRARGLRVFQVAEGGF